VIRPFEPADAEAVVALVRGVAEDWVVSPQGLSYRMAAHPQRARQEAWVAVEDGLVVGFARARLLWEVASERAATLWLAVRAEKRRRGIGSALLRQAENHLERAGAGKLESFADEEAGRAFLEAHGFQRSRVEHVSALDPRLVDPSAAELEEAKAAEGFRLVSLADVLDRPQELHAVYAGVLVDVPGHFTEDDLRYDEWVRECLGDPDLSSAGSSVVLSAERVVALSFLLTDGTGRGASDLTGTLPEFRRRGLARLAKLRTIRWAADNGIEQMVTGNDEQNAGILALNRSLGYKPLAERTFYLRGG
jgi:ribosomal protein S18 acetylase RimI-like enzyme